MLQRAASSAYSWWWASHIRTKQSKWLEQSLQDMEDKVQSMLTLIEEDGDSFAKRAEMYYKRRPELISSVEEAYKVFRSLADRYDMLSKELQNANHTIATVFPEQVQFSMADDEDCPKPTKRIPPNMNNMGKNIPQAPTKAPTKNLKTIITKASKQHQANKRRQKKRSQEIEKSGLTKAQGFEEIKKLQKDILALQTVKEFVKSSYESGLEKYYDIENQIMEMQQKVSRLQDEFNMDSLIEDDEARTLMAEAALKSCQQTLVMLQEKQEKSIKEAQREYQRIETACQRLQSLREKFKLPQGEEEEGSNELQKSSSRELDDLIAETKEIELLPDDKSTKDILDLSSIQGLTVSQLADKIDQLVNKVIGLETAISSQTVLVNTLRTETDHLNSDIKTFEEEQDSLIDDTSDLSTRVKKMEEKLNKIQDLNKNVFTQNGNLRTSFAEARTNLGHLSEKLSNVKPDEEDTEEDKLLQEENRDKKPEDMEVVKEVDVDIQVVDTSVTKQGEIEKEITPAMKQCDIEKEITPATRQWDIEKEITPATKQWDIEKEIREAETILEQKAKERVHSEPAYAEETEKDENGNWQEMLLSGIEEEDRETILLKEYTTILRNYKDLKKKLNEKEKNEKDMQFDTTVQMRDLKKAILKRDEEIQNLRQRLNVVGQDDHKDVKEDKTGDEEIEKPQPPSVELEKGNEGQDVIDKDRDVGKREDDDIKLIMVDRTQSISNVEEKIRSDIDAIQDENLDFWLRFSTTFHQIQKFKTEIKDLTDEISKLKEKKKQEGNGNLKSDLRPIYKHLREIQTELTMWLEQSGALKDELKRRFTSLSSIQEEITKALNEGTEEDEVRFSSHQAAKFQGEILNMKNENNKVREELQTGLDNVKYLQLENEKTLRKLDEEFADEQPDNLSRPRVPLRSFIFGTKPKKKHSLFSCMHPQRRYQILRTGIRLSHHHN